MKEKIIKISILLAVELAIILLICGLNGVLTTDLPPKEVTRFVCDGFFSAGLLFICFGGFVWTKKQGAYDGFGYTVNLWKDQIFNNKRDWHAKEKYADYKERVAEKNKKKSFSEFLLVGGVSTVIASILLIVYNFAF